MIGRDHLDAGSVASPERETEAMLDGSDAVADWPMLNALLNTACGASWVSIHHGGGVGMGKSIHAGQVCVADGTDLAAPSASSRTLKADPGLGIVRHVDAGYDLAVSAAARSRAADADARVGVRRRRAGVITMQNVATRLAPHPPSAHKHLRGAYVHTVAPGGGGLSRFASPPTALGPR